MRDPHSPADRATLERIEAATRVVSKPDRPYAVSVVDDHGQLSVLDRDTGLRRPVTEFPDADHHIVITVVHPDPTAAQRNYYIAAGHWTEDQEVTWQARQALLACGGPP